MSAIPPLIPRPDFSSSTATNPISDKKVLTPPNPPSNPTPAPVASMHPASVPATAAASVHPAPATAATPAPVSTSLPVLASAPAPPRTAPVISNPPTSQTPTPISSSTPAITTKLAPIPAPLPASLPAPTSAPGPASAPPPPTLPLPAPATVPPPAPPPAPAPTTASAPNPSTPSNAPRSTPISNSPMSLPASAQTPTPPQPNLPPPATTTPVSSTPVPAATTASVPPPASSATPASTTPPSSTPNRPSTSTSAVPAAPTTSAPVQHTKSKLENSPPNPPSSEDDPIRAFLDVDASKRPSESLLDLAWDRVPTTIQQGLDSIRIVSLPSGQVRDCASTVNIRSHTILRVGVQRRILAAKLVQRQLSLRSVYECSSMNDFRDGAIVSAKHHVIRMLPPTSVWRNPDSKIPFSEIPWFHGDIPVFDSTGAVIPGRPELPFSPETAARKHADMRAAHRRRSNVLGSALSPARSASTPNSAARPRRAVRAPEHFSPDPTPTRGRSVREEVSPSPSASGSPIGTPSASPPSSLSDDPQAAVSTPRRASASGSRRAPALSPSEIARLLHVLALPTMSKALSVVARDPRDPAPWETDILKRYVDKSFAPKVISKLPSSVRIEDLSGVDPEELECVRTADELRVAFSKFRLELQDGLRVYYRNRKSMTDPFINFFAGGPQFTYAHALMQVQKGLQGVLLTPTPGPTGTTVAPVGDLEVMNAKTSGVGGSSGVVVPTGPGRKRRSGMNEGQGRVQRRRTAPMKRTSGVVVGGAVSGSPGRVADTGEGNTVGSMDEYVKRVCSLSQAINSMHQTISLQKDASMKASFEKVLATLELRLATLENAKPDVEMMEATANGNA